MLHMRPHNRFEDVERMYLVGGGTHPGSGLPVIYSSARITTDLLLDDLGISRPVATSVRSATGRVRGEEPAAAV
jgi:phytoene desaturase